MKTYLETWFLYPIPGVDYEVSVTVIPPTRCPGHPADPTMYAEQVIITQAHGRVMVKDIVP